MRAKKTGTIFGLLFVEGTNQRVVVALLTFSSKAINSCRSSGYW